jgi:hypothetical protein
MTFATAQTLSGFSDSGPAGRTGAAGRSRIDEPLAEGREKSMNTFILAASSVLLALATSAAAHDECFITIGVGTSTPLAAFSATVDYQDAPGEFEGSGNVGTCEPLSSYSLSTNDVDAERKLSIGLLSIGNPIVGPKDLLRCKWLPTSRWPVAADFDLSQQQGLTADLDVVDAMVSITSIDCESVTTTTIATTTTTSTLPDVLCGDWDGNDEILVSDALGVLRTSVGSVECPLCICDMDGNGKVFVSDALMALRIAVGVDVTTNCSAC